MEGRPTPHDRADAEALAELPLGHLRTMLKVARKADSDSPLIVTLEAAIEARSADRSIKQTMTWAELAERLDVSQRHLQREAIKGAIPQPVRLGRRTRFLVAVIDAWFDDGCPHVQGTDWSYADWKMRQRHPSLTWPSRKPGRR